MTKTNLADREQLSYKSSGLFYLETACFRPLGTSLFSDNHDISKSIFYCQN